MPAAKFFLLNQSDAHFDEANRPQVTAQTCATCKVRRHFLWCHVPVVGRRATLNDAGNLLLDLNGLNEPIIGTTVDAVSQYNTLRIDFDAVTQDATVSVNGVSVLSGWGGVVGSVGPVVRFGAAHSARVGGANYASVVFTSNPIPAT